MINLNFSSETFYWENMDFGETCRDIMPRARAGHCSVGIHTRIYVWSGRDGYCKISYNQVHFLKYFLNIAILSYYFF